MDAVQVAKNTYAIDPVIFGIEKFTSVYLLVGDTLALVDSGSPKSTTIILNGIRSLGYDPKDVTKIILSHIHFDHGSGAGALLNYLPQAMVYVHGKGYNHLVNPSRLTKSARAVFGTLIDEWYGDFSPVPPEKIISLKDNDSIELGTERSLTVIESQGHAKHEICLYDSSVRGIFTGDEAGVYFPECDVIIPTSPPPDFNPDLNVRSISRLKSLNPELLFFAHYLTAESANSVLERYVAVLEAWNDIVVEGLRRQAGLDDIVRLLRAEVQDMLKPIEHRKELFTWILDHHIPMCVRGYVHHFQKKGFDYKIS